MGRIVLKNVVAAFIGALVCVPLTVLFGLMSFWQAVQVCGGVSVILTLHGVAVDWWRSRRPKR
ncbi:hypothetical protein [Streptomyces cadmiisoli]|uniref:Uncharacterized protein n=1 Tax=Streptomyces cadmiisoli TaxID=2184053 RepID=A0A2Z4JC73_9ACTN|nr:hypothetical protein [Streptomyces cadmiisoli]AWW41953.1 hypothetical protein DN051_39470 [Streptomyces cadmiisoli]